SGRSGRGGPSARRGQSSTIDPTSRKAASMAEVKSAWWVVRAFLPPVVLAALVFLALREPLSWWLHGEGIYDQEAIREWVREARVFTTLPDLVRVYLDMAGRRNQLKDRLQASTADQDQAQRDLRDLEKSLAMKREDIHEHLKALGNPPTKMYTGQL